MVRSFLKGLQIIELLSQHTSLTVTSISDQLGMDKSTVSRHLATAMEMGYVTKASNGSYTLDLGILRLSARILKRNELIHQAVPYIGRLLQEVGGQVFLGVIWRGVIINLFTTHDTDNLMDELDLESGSPIHVSSTAKSILAFQPEEAVRQVLTETGMQRYTPNTITDIDGFVRELEQVRLLKYSVNDFEFGPGCSIAAPVRRFDGHVVAGLAVAGSLSLDELRRDVSPILINYANMISYSLGYNGESMDLMVNHNRKHRRRKGVETL